MFEQHDNYLATLPDELDRESVRAACADAAADPEAAEKAFIVAMVWGYGTVGYGPWRVRRILTQNRAAARKLHAVATTLLGEGAATAYAQFSEYGGCRLRFLGPAFGTKYLAFCGPNAQPAPLILDRLVAAWLSANVNATFDSISWRPKTYGRYLDQMSHWSRSLDVRPDELECRIFTAQADLGQNQWRSPVPIPG